LIREFTVIPDFQKLGYELVAFTLVKTKSGLSVDELEKARQISLRDMREKSPPEIVLFERGLGGGYTSIIVSFHHNYTEYAKARAQGNDEGIPVSRPRSNLELLVGLERQHPLQILHFFNTRQTPFDD
jgi:hypothetical protein